MDWRLWYLEPKTPEEELDKEIMKFIVDSGKKQREFKLKNWFLEIFRY